MTSSPVRRTATVLGVVALIALGWWLLGPSQLGGRTSYAVVSGSSMQPRVERGDFVLVRKRADYEPGDVVLYDNPTVGANVLHRIVARDSDGFRLKGDANGFVDDVRPTPDQIVGELWLVIPGFGSVVTWLQQPLNALLVILASVLIALAGGREATRRNRRRPGAPARAIGVAPRGASDPIFAPRTLRHAALAALVLFGFVAAVGWARPGSRQTVAHGLYAHTGSFSYAAAVPKSPVYPDGRVTTGDSAFVSLVQRLQVAFFYRLETARTPQVSGTTRIDATISDGAGWTRSVPVASLRAFEGGDAVAAGVLDLDHLEHVVAQMKELTGSGTSTFTVTLVPRIHVAGEAGRHPVDATFAPSLPFQLDPTALRLLDPDGGDPALEAREDPAVPVTIATSVGLGPLSVPTRDARLLGLLGVVAALVLLLTAGSLARREPGKAADVRLRFGSRIVDAEAVVPPGRWVTDVGRARDPRPHRGVVRAAGGARVRARARRLPRRRRGRRVPLHDATLGPAGGSGDRDPARAGPMNWLPLRVAPVLLAVALVSVAAFTAANVVPATRVGSYGAAVSPNDLKPPECAALNLIEIRVSGGAGGGNSLVLGTAGNDNLVGASGDDCLVGGAGNDSLKGNAGSDVCIGGPRDRHVPRQLRSPDPVTPGRLRSPL